MNRTSEEKEKREREKERQRVEKMKREISRERRNKSQKTNEGTERLARGRGNVQYRGTSPDSSFPHLSDSSQGRSSDDLGEHAINTKKRSLDDAFETASSRRRSLRASRA